MNDMDDTLKRYYNGDTTLEEERALRDAYRRGELPDEPVLAYRGTETALPGALRDRINRRIGQHARRLWLARTATAAGIALLIGICLLIPRQPDRTLALTDTVKRERFEDAMRVIGQVLDEPPAAPQRVLYEDNRLIIVVE